MLLTGGVALLLLVAQRHAQEDMYSFVTVAEDQTTKGKGTAIVQDA